MPRSRHPNRVVHVVALALAAALATGGSAAAQTSPPPEERENTPFIVQPPATRSDGLRGRIDPDAEEVFGPLDPEREDGEPRRRDSHTLATERARDAETDPNRDPADESIVGEPEDDRDRPDSLLDPGAEPDPDLANRLRDREPAEGEEPDTGDTPPGPYEPLGVRVGSFLLYPELLLETLFTDNVLQAPDLTQNDHAYSVTPSLTFRSDWNRHLFEGEVRALKSSYADFDRQNNESFLASTHSRYDLTRRTNIETRSAYARELDDLVSEDTPEGAAERTPLKTISSSVRLNHRFNRLTASLRGAIEEIDYDDVALIGGGVANNDDRDNIEKELTARLSYEFRPGVASFVESAVNDRSYDSVFDDNGLRRDSDGYRVLAGIALDFGGKLTGEFAAGFARQSPVDPRLEDVDGPIFNAALTWQATALTRFTLTATSEIEDSTAIDSAGSLRRTVEFAVEHTFRPNLIAGLALGYENEDFTQSGLVDEDYVVGVRGEYLLSRALALVGRYEFSKSTSNVPGNDYVENQVRLGVRLRR